MLQAVNMTETESASHSRNKEPSWWMNRLEGLAETDGKESASSNTGLKNGTRVCAAELQLLLGYWCIFLQTEETQRS